MVFDVQTGQPLPSLADSLSIHLGKVRSGTNELARIPPVVCNWGVKPRAAAAEAGGWCNFSCQLHSTPPCADILPPLLLLIWKWRFLLLSLERFFRRLRTTDGFSCIPRTGNGEMEGWEREKYWVLNSIGEYDVILAHEYMNGLYCPCPTHYCHCPTARDRGCRVYSLLWQDMLNYAIFHWANHI